MSARLRKLSPTIGTSASGHEDLYEDHTLLPPSTAPSSTLQLSSRLRIFAQRRLRSILYFILFATLYISAGVLFIKHYRDILSALEHLAEYLRTTGFPGSFILILLIAATAFPLVPGYGTLTTFAGFVYGFPLGFLPAFCGALFGAMACFSISRHVGGVRVKRWLSNYKYLAGLIHAVDAKGFRLLVLIRLAPYPYNLVNVALSATGVPLHGFVLATALSLVKLAIHVVIGANLERLHNDLVVEPTLGRIAGVAASAMFGVGMFVYLMYLARRAIDEVESKKMVSEMENGRPVYYEEDVSEEEASVTASL